MKVKNVLYIKFFFFFFCKFVEIYIIVNYYKDNKYEHEKIMYNIFIIAAISKRSLDLKTNYFGSLFVGVTVTGQ